MKLRVNSVSREVTIKKILFSSIIIFSIIILDQVTKALAGRFLPTVCNTGFAFGIFPGLFNSLVTILTLLIVIYFFYSERKNSDIYAPDGVSFKRGRENHGLQDVGIYTLGSDSQSTHFKKGPTLERVLGFSLIIGGGASNIVDRLTRGCVVDFIRWPSQTWPLLPDWLQSSLTRWPAFNLADVAITIGVASLIFSIVKELNDKKT